MERIKEALKSVFEDFDEKVFNEDMQLGSIPDWDSMNSISLQMELELIFDVDLSETVLKDEHRVSDLLAILRAAGVSI